MQTNNISQHSGSPYLLASALTLAGAFAFSSSQAIEDPLAFALTSSPAIGAPLDCGPTPSPTPYPSPCSNPPTFSVYVCAYDGYRLKTDVYLKDSTQRPVLVQRGQTSCDIVYDRNTADYHLVVQERRPDGLVNEPNFLYSADQDDGHALLDQIASQNSFPWGNGHIFMEGASAGGIVTYVAAPGATPALRGIKTSFATGDLLNYGLFNGGVLHRDVVDRSVPRSGLPQSWRDYVALGIWNNYLITPNDASRAHVAGLHKGGWFDVFGQGTLDSFSRLQAVEGNNPSLRQKVVIGPWLHGGPTPNPSQTVFPSANQPNPSLTAYETAWKQCVYGASPTPCNAWQALPAVQVYHMGAPAPQWRTYSTWPPPAQEYSLYFASGGNLLSAGATPPPSGGQVAFTSNPNSPCPTLGGTNNLISCNEFGGTCGPYDQREIEARSDVRVFTSDPGTAWIVGRIYADVWIQTDLPDVDVFVRMTDVSPDGKSRLMAQGIQRARYRNGVCPVLPLDLTQPTRVRVDLGSTALVLPPASPANQHKLRVIVSASAGASLGSPPLTPPLYDVNPQNGDEYIINPRFNRTGSITVRFGTDYPSALVIPVPTGTATPPDRRPNTTPCPP